MITPPPPLLNIWDFKRICCKEREREREISKAIKKCFINQVAQAKWREMTKSNIQKKEIANYDKMNK